MSVEHHEFESPPLEFNIAFNGADPLNTISPSINFNLSIDLSGETLTSFFFDFFSNIFFFFLGAFSTDFYYDSLKEPSTWYSTCTKLPSSAFSTSRLNKLANTLSIED